MDVLLVRRRRLTDAPAPFKCACGNQVSGWKVPFDLVARCPTCKDSTYHLLRSQITADGEARELVVAARGIVESDRPSFEAQGFHVLIPTGARFFPDVPTITGELTNADGTLLGAMNE